ncbi:MAG: ferredoxin [Leptonema sp. (in: bacteria)]
MENEILNKNLSTSLEYKIVYINKIDCTSCNSCTANLPEYFRMDELDLSETHNNGTNINNAIVYKEDWEKIQKQMEICPGECILWKE